VVFNVQEIIQTRIYKFKVVFEDNTSTVVETKENSAEYIKFMAHLDKDLEIKDAPTTKQIDPTEDDNNLIEFWNILEKKLIV
jgi:hypothetical protein